MLFAELVAASQRIAATSKRLAKIEILSDLLKRLAPEEVDLAVAWLSGTTLQGRVGVGYAGLKNAFGDPAAEPNLQVFEVDRFLTQIASVQGAGSEAGRRELLRSLLARATKEEQNFVAGLLLGEIRQGALEGIMLDAIAKASNISPDRVRRAAMMAGGVSAIARRALESGENGLTSFDVQLFRPVQPMLAATAEDVSDALEQLGEAAFEFKFDGARVQAHKSGDEVRIYSRASNDVSGAIPEIVEAVRSLPGRELILDGEVLSLDPQGRAQPFQVSMRRFGRRLNVEQLRAELPMSPFWFDILYENGSSLIDETQSRRFAELERLVPLDAIVPHLATSDQAAADEFLRQALERGNEGIMAKARSASYAAGARGQSWLKIKPARTLDLVILAAEWGSGRRQGWLSNLHLGARDTEKGGFAMLGKTFKGLTDEMLAWQTQEFLKIEVARDRHTVYLEPKIVAEIAFNEIQISSRYESGLALRFARVKQYRSDKSADEADTFQAVRHLAGLC